MTTNQTKPIAARDELLTPEDACPNCGNRQKDELIWIENSAIVNEVECQRCGMVFRLICAV